MTREMIEKKEAYFYQIGREIINMLEASEELTINLSGENTVFTRINNAKIRQVIDIEQCYINLILIKDDKSIKYKLPLTFNHQNDISEIERVINDCREEFKTLPLDPYIIFPVNNGVSSNNHYGNIPNNLVQLVLDKVQNIDFTGLITSGSVFKGNINSKGQKHWFSTENFQIDFSIYSKEQHAVKAMYADDNWNIAEFEAKFNDSVHKLEMLQKPQKILEPGKYRSYFAPSAINDIIEILSWNGVNANSVKQGQSAFKKLAQGENLSRLFSLSEDFTLGLVPKFNEMGEISEDIISIVKEGRLENLLTSTKTAKEYGLKSNNAESSEMMRSPSMAKGSLSKNQILKQLDTGLYISNLHYLNWSDLNAGRITGMTRYACFWIEDGEIICPIKNMRFDETLYNFFSENLEAVTDFQELIPQTRSYEERTIGGILVPGMIVKEFNYTL